MVRFGKSQQRMGPGKLFDLAASGAYTHIFSHPPVFPLNIA